MKNAIWAIALFAASAFSADATGKWSGTFHMKQGNGTIVEHAAVFEFKQIGNQLTGSGGPSTDRMLPIEGGTVEGNRIHFAVSPPNEVKWTFDLVVDGDHLTGEINGEEGGEPMKSTLEATRSK